MKNLQTSEKVTRKKIISLSLFLFCTVLNTLKKRNTVLHNHTTHIKNIDIFTRELHTSSFYRYKNTFSIIFLCTLFNVVQNCTELT